jgi:hypothetical protein
VPLVPMWPRCVHVQPWYPRQPKRQRRGYAGMLNNLSDTLPTLVARLMSHIKYIASNQKNCISHFQLFIWCVPLAEILPPASMDIFMLPTVSAAPRCELFPHRNIRAPGIASAALEIFASLHYLLCISISLTPHFWPRICILSKAIHGGSFPPSEL